MHKCPYCLSSIDDVPVRAIHKSSSSQESFRIFCPNCDNAIILSIERVVKIRSITKGIHKIDDWGNKQKKG